MENVLLEIRKLEEYSLTNVNMIALVTETSSEVMFYCDYKGNRVQSNSIVEDGLIEASVIDDFYDTVTKLIREDVEFMSDKMNIIKCDCEKVLVAYDEKNCRTYNIMKEWIKSTN